MANSGAENAERGARDDIRISEHPILTFTPGSEVSFSYEGRQFRGREGEPIAVALLAAGVKVFRPSTKLGRPRGLFCAIGNCSSCLMEVDGRSNVRVCVEKLRDGMDVRVQRDKGRLK